MYTNIHPHSKVCDKMLVISISIRATNGSDLMGEGDEDGETFKHEYTYRNKT